MIENVTIHKRGEFWHIAIHGNGFIGEGEAEHLAEAFKTALNNWLRYVATNRKD